MPHTQDLFGARWLASALCARAAAFERTFLNGVRVRLNSPAVTVWNSTPSFLSRSYTFGIWQHAHREEAAEGAGRIFTFWVSGTGHRAEMRCGLCASAVGAPGQTHLGDDTNRA